MAQIIDGKKISQDIKDELKEKVTALKDTGTEVALAVIQVGNDPASSVYVRNKKKACEYIGIRSLSYELPEETTEDALIELIEKLNKELETRTDYESDSYMALIEEVSALSEKFYSIDATNYEEDVEKALLGLGFTRSDFQRQTSDFSGGWRMRIELAKLLLQKPDVLLLDEPTNHLDIESIQWLEDFLINNGKAVIVISHDRKFVDNITTVSYTHLTLPTT